MPVPTHSSSPTACQSPAGASIVDIDHFAGSNILGEDPQLGALAANGGPTQTLKPSLTSPVLDKGIATAAFTADQRGLSRPFDIPTVTNTTTGDAADIGAVELQASDFATAAAPAPGPAPATTKKKKCKKKKHKRSADAARRRSAKRRRSASSQVWASRRGHGLTSLCVGFSLA